MLQIQPFTQISIERHNKPINNIMNMRKIDISSLIESIENSFMDNGVVFEVECVSPEEVVEDVRYFKTIKDILEHPSLFEEHQWVKIAHGHTYAFVRVKLDEDKLSTLVYVTENCPVEDFEQMIVDGINEYANNEGLESAISVSPSGSRTPIQQ